MLGTNRLNQPSRTPFRTPSRSPMPRSGPTARETTCAPFSVSQKASINSTSVPKASSGKSADALQDIVPSKDVSSTAMGSVQLLKPGFERTKSAFGKSGPSPFNVTLRSSRETCSILGLRHGPEGDTVTSRSSGRALLVAAAFFCCLGACGRACLGFLALTE